MVAGGWTQLYITNSNRYVILQCIYYLTYTYSCEVVVKQIIIIIKPFTCFY